METDGANGSASASSSSGHAPASAPGAAQDSTSSGQGAPSRDLGDLAARFLSRIRVAWVWGVHGLLGVVLGLVLLGQLGATAGTVRALVALWVLLTAGAIALRWELDGRRSRYLLLAAVIGLVAGVLVLLGGGLSLAAIRWAIGIFWVAAGVLELIAWREGAGSALEWPWIAGLAVFVGVMTITWPSPLVTEFTVLAGVWAIALGVAHIARWLWLVLHHDELAVPVRARPRPARVLLVALPAVLLAVPVLLYGKVWIGSVSEGGRQASLDAFYKVPTDLAPGAPGSIIRIEPASTPGIHGRGWRILFRSQDTHGAMTVSSGVVYAPSSPGSERLVVAWAHGTVGLAPQCAPSRQEADPALTPFLNDMLAHNWVVTAPDYVGAGGTGGTGGTGATELYLIGAEQARDLLNGVRAAENIPEADAGTRFAIYGHSQGGNVALTGAALALTYTPELRVVAVGAVSAAADGGTILHGVWQSPLASWILGPMVVYPWTRYYPNLDVRPILSPAALNHYREMALNNCITDIGPALLNPRMGDFFAEDPSTDPAWGAALLANQAPLTPDGVPVFIGHGLADTLITPTLSAWLVERFCAAGRAVAADWLPGVGHGEAAIDAAPRYIAWLSAIAQGQQPLTDCGKPLPVKPAQPLMAFP